VDRTAPLIVITGPTGSGKTAMALELARGFPLEAISADSMQVYRHMDIATAKPTREEQALLPHHLIDIREPDEEFNAGMFLTLGDQAIPEIRSRGRIPVVVGGTGLYIKALLYGLAPAPPSSPELRSWFRSLIRSKGSGHLWLMLEKNDPEIARRTNKNDSVRIIRFLEMVFLTGMKPSTAFHEHGFSRPRHPARIVCVMGDRETLYRNIDERVKAMVDHGLVEETERLLALGFDPGLRSMQTLAYKHVVDYLDSRIGLEATISRIQRDTRHYAKRQQTWMRSHHAADCFRTPDEARKILSAWLDETRKGSRI
jgi:tRNA dimethylallyltransferase